MKKITLTLTIEEFYELIEVLRSKLQWRLNEENNTEDLINLYQKLLSIDVQNKQKEQTKWKK